jgi:hypothetical protein
MGLSIVSFSYFKKKSISHKQNLSLTVKFPGLSYTIILYVFFSDIITQSCCIFFFQAQVRFLYSNANVGTVLMFSES